MDPKTVVVLSIVAVVVIAVLKWDRDRWKSVAQSETRDHNNTKSALQSAKDQLAEKAREVQALRTRLSQGPQQA